MKNISKDKMVELLKQINQGDCEAFEQVYDFYLKKIYRFTLNYETTQTFQNDIKLKY